MSKSETWRTVSIHELANGYGIGKELAQKLDDAGIKTLGDLVDAGSQSGLVGPVKAFEDRKGASHILEI